MHAVQKAHREEGSVDRAPMETARLILSRPAAPGNPAEARTLSFTVLAKADRRLVARMTFVAERGQEARLTLSLGVGPGIPDLMAEAAQAAVPMAMRALGTRILSARAPAGDQATIGVLRRLGMQSYRRAAGAGAAAAMVRFEKDLCGIM